MHIVLKRAGCADSCFTGHNTHIGCHRSNEASWHRHLHKTSCANITSYWKITFSGTGLPIQVFAKI